MKRINLFLLSLLILNLQPSGRTYADAPGNSIKFNLNVTSPQLPYVTFSHLKGQSPDQHESEMIMLGQDKGNVKRQIPAALQIVSFSDIPVLVNGGEVNLSMVQLKKRTNGRGYAAIFKGPDAFKQSLPYLMDSLYYIPVEKLTIMNTDALKGYFSGRGKQVQGLLNKAKIKDPQEKALLLRYESVLRVKLADAFNNAHYEKKDLPEGTLGALLEQENSKGDDLNRICKEDIMNTFAQVLMAGKSQPGDSRLTKMEVLLKDGNQLFIKQYIPAEFRVMFRKKGLTPELASFYAKFKQACTDTELLKELDEFYTYQVNLTPGKPAPDFGLRDYHGKTVKISDFKGKMLVIDCWGTWCSGCLYNLPFFEKVAESYKDSTDIVFMSLALEPEDGISWKNYIKEHHMEDGINLHLVDNQNDPTWILLRKAYHLDSYPRYIVIDRQGNFIDAYLDYPQFPAFKEKIDQWYKEKR